MITVSKSVSQVVKRSRDMSTALVEFGQAFTWLATSEGEGLGQVLTMIGNSADQLSVATAEFAEAESVTLEEPMQEYVRIVGAVKSAINRRQEKKQEYIRYRKQYFNNITTFLTLALQHCASEL